jgi:hypothetical protein
MAGRFAKRCSGEEQSDFVREDSPFVFLIGTAWATAYDARMPKIGGSIESATVGVTNFNSQSLPNLLDVMARECAVVALDS